MDVSFRREESPKTPGRRWLLSQVLRDGGVGWARHMPDDESNMAKAVRGESTRPRAGKQTAECAWSPRKPAGKG